MITIYNPKIHGYSVTCKACHAPFYDLGKNDPTCPHCQTPYSKSMKSKAKSSAVADIEEDEDGIAEIVVEE